MEAIQSVREQDYVPKRIIVIDDGSKDNPKRQIDNWGDASIEDGVCYYDGKTPIIFFRNEEPTGPAAARNLAMSMTWDISEVFMMLDADDRYLPGKISKSVAKYREDTKRIGIVYSDAIIENRKTGTQIHEFRKPFDRLALEQECIISNTPLVSKEAIRQSAGYDESMRTCEDWDLWLRITEHFVAVHIPEALHVYSVTGQNSSDTVPAEVWQANWQKIREKLQKRHG
jgi:glycosyltransferase involved in cell wall biosynthesis